MKTNILESRFQRRLEQSIVRNSFILVVIGCALFCMAIAFMHYYSTKADEKEYLDYLENRLDQVCASVEGYMTDPYNSSLFVRELQGQSIGPEISYSATRFNAENNLRINVILSDTEGNMVFSTYPEQEMNSHREEFSKIVCGKTGPDNGVYNTVYYLLGLHSEYVFSMPAVQDGKLQGYAAVYLSGAGLESVFSDYQFDCIITNKAGQIIYNSKSSFVPERNTNKYRASAEEHSVRLNSTHYIEVGREMKNRDIALYAFLYDPHDYRYTLIGIGTILATGLIWFVMSRTVIRTLAGRNAESANKLISEIGIISRGDSTHEVNIRTDDEFEEVGVQINRMLRSINELNVRNSELIKLNAAMEIKNLQTQINPHFIYNTLDNIRYLIPLNPEKASALIGDFTKILRYSINNEKKSIPLEEDMNYLRSYINIQEVRFGKRFAYTDDISPDCLKCLVPKLFIQPLVENSIKYGFKRKTNIHVDVRAEREGNYLVITVEDDGFGVPEPTLATLRSVIHTPNAEINHNGLQSISRRLELEYGHESGMQIESEDGEFFRVVMKLYCGGDGNVQCNCSGG